MPPLLNIFLLAWLASLYALLIALPAAPPPANRPSSHAMGGRPLSVRDWGAVCDGVADDSTSLSNAVNALANIGAELDVPGDCRLRLGGSTQVWLRGVHLAGPGVRELGSQGYTYGTQGGTIIVDTPSSRAGGAAPFVVSSDWSMTGLNFYWPGQTEYTAAANGKTPVPFPPLITSHGHDNVYSWTFSNNQVENAYDIADFSKANGAGHFHWEGNQEFAERYHLRLRVAGGESWVNNNQFSIIASLYLNSGTNKAGPKGAQSPFYLRTFATNHAEILRIDGDGTASEPAKTAVEGMRMHGNYALGLRYGIHAVGGILNIADLTGNTYDQVSTPMAADSGGAFYAVTVTGGDWLCQNLSSSVFVAPCFIVDGGTPGSRITFDNVQIPGTVGPAIIFNDSGDALFSFTGGDILNFGNKNEGNPYDGLILNAPNGVLILSGTEISTTAKNNNFAKCLIIKGAKSAVVMGVIFRGCRVPVFVSAEKGAYTATGNTSFESTAAVGAAAILGPGAPLVSQAGNNWNTPRH